MLLRKMGWKEGQGLGIRSDGQLQPIQVSTYERATNQLYLLITVSRFIEVEFWRL